MMWSEKYRPRSIREMVGNEQPRAEVLKWFRHWKRGTQPLLLVGPPGTGKTTIARLAAEQFQYDVIGMNASDARSKSKIRDILEPVMGISGILQQQMVFVDEVDGIHGRADFGGADALIGILKEATVPVLLASNTDDSAKMRAISKVAKTVKFQRVPPRLLRVYLQDILAREGVRMGPGTLTRILVRSRGDIRSIINSAQAQISGTDPPDARVFEALDVEAGVEAFFKAGSTDEARSVLYSMRVDPREKIGAFYSSVVTAGLDAQEAARMLSILSEADVLYGRILRTQNWRLLRYLDGMLLELYRPGVRVRFTRYSIPWPLLNRIRWDGAKLKALCGILASSLHASRSTIALFDLPAAIRCGPDNLAEMAPEFEETIQKEAGK